MCCSDHLFHLNYSITLFNNDELERAHAHFMEFETLFAVRDARAASAGWLCRQCIVLVYLPHGGLAAGTG